MIVNLLSYSVRPHSSPALWKSHGTQTAVEWTESSSRRWPDSQLSQWVSSLNRVVKVLDLQHQSFQWISSWFPLGLTDLISLLSRDSRQSSPAPRFEGINSVHSSVYICQGQFPNPSHPPFPTWCPYFCSLVLCLYFCFANRFICTTFLDFA